MKPPILTLVAIVLSFGLKATGLHNGSIAGVVRDAVTQLELPGATVEIVELEKAAYTNDLGYFSFDNLPAGSYTLRVRYLAYETSELKLVHVENNATRSLRVFLAPTQFDLPNVVVQAPARAPFTNITQLDTKTRPITNGQELLTLMPGLFIAQHAGGGKAEQIFFRGFDIDHGTDLAINVDGIPVNMVSHAHGQGYADMHFVIPEIIESVELRRGPYDAEDGNFATAGAVELRTSNRLENNFLQLDAGQFDTYRLATGFNLLPDQGGAKPSAYLAATGLVTDGYFESPQNFHRLNVFGKYFHPISDQQSLTASVSHFSSEWDASGQIPQRAVHQGLISRFGAIDDTEGGLTSRSNINLEYQQQINRKTSIKNQLYYTHYDFELYSNFTFFARDEENGDQIRQREDRHLIGYTSTVLHQSTIGSMPFHGQAGWQVRFDRSRDNELSYTRNRSTTLTPVQLGNVNELNAALYAEGDLWLSDQLRLHVGLRYDRFRFQYRDQLEETYQQLSATNDVFSPKLNLFYELRPGLQLYARAGSGFHSNDSRVILEGVVEESLPRAIGYELGGIFRTGKRVLWQLNAWALDSEQEFVYVGDEGIVEPSGRSRRRGLEGLVRWQLAAGLFLDADLTYTQARSVEEAEGTDHIPLAPKWTSTGGLSYSPENGWQAALRYRFLGDRPADETYSLTATGYTLIDCSLGYKTDRFYMGLQVGNLLDSAWNEAQFATESRLNAEVEPVEEIHFTPGSPFRLSGRMALYF